MDTCVQPLLRQPDARLKKNVPLRCASKKIEWAEHWTSSSQVSPHTLNTQPPIRHEERTSLPSGRFFLKDSAHSLNTTKEKCRNFPSSKREYSETHTHNILHYFAGSHPAALVFSGFGTHHSTRKPRLALGDSIAVRSTQGKNCLPDLAYLLTLFERTPFKASKFDHHLLRTWQNHSYPVQQTSLVHNSNRSTACYNMALKTLFVRH